MFFPKNTLYGLIGGLWSDNMSQMPNFPKLSYNKADDTRHLKEVQAYDRQIQEEEDFDYQQLLQGYTKVFNASHMIPSAVRDEAGFNHTRKRMNILTRLSIMQGYDNLRHYRINIQNLEMDKYRLDAASVNLQMQREMQSLNIVHSLLDYILPLF